MKTFGQVLESDMKVVAEAAAVDLGYEMEKVDEALNEAHDKFLALKAKLEKKPALMKKFKADFKALESGLDNALMASAELVDGMLEEA